MLHRNVCEEERELVLRTTTDRVLINVARLSKLLYQFRGYTMRHEALSLLIRAPSRQLFGA